MPIQWRAQLAVDQGVIDHDHQILIMIINQFCCPGPNEEELSRMRSVLKKLEHYTRIHFSREEKLQITVRYPYCDAHHQEHRDLMRQLDQMQRMLEPYLKPVTEDEEKQEIPFATLRAKIDALLHDWLVDHVVKSDLRMKPYAAAIAQHGSKLEPMMQGEQMDELDSVVLDF